MITDPKVCKRFFDSEIAFRVFMVDVFLDYISREKTPVGEFNIAMIPRPLLFNGSLPKPHVSFVDRWGDSSDDDYTRVEMRYDTQNPLALRDQLFNSYLVNRMYGCAIIVGYFDVTVTFDVPKRCIRKWADSNVRIGYPKRPPTSISGTRNMVLNFEDGFVVDDDTDLVFAGHGDYDNLIVPNSMMFHLIGGSNNERSLEERIRNLEERLAAVERLL